jgi:hypothetical protein
MADRSTHGVGSGQHCWPAVSAGRWPPSQDDVRNCPDGCGTYRRPLYWAGSHIRKASTEHRLTVEAARPVGRGRCHIVWSDLAGDDRFTVRPDVSRVDVSPSTGSCVTALSSGRAAPVLPTKRTGPRGTYRVPMQAPCGGQGEARAARRAPRCAPIKDRSHRVRPLRSGASGSTPSCQSCAVASMVRRRAGRIVSYLDVALFGPNCPRS